MTVDSRRLGAGGPVVFPMALGCAAMSGVRGPGPNDAESIATIHAAIDRGVNLIDTADFYGSGHNELLIGRALQGRRDQVQLSVKFNGQRGPDGAFVGIDGRPASVKNYLAYTLTRLGVDHVDIYRPARLDPQVPIEDTVGAIADLVKAGWVRHIGLSEVGPNTIRRAQAVHPICDVQLEYSLMNRQPERHILPVLDELGIGLTAYGVLAHGLLSGRAKPAGSSGERSHLPWFKGENFERNMTLVDALGRIAKDRGTSTSQLAIAWALARGPAVVAVVGARRPEQLHESLGALALKLSAEEIACIEQAIPPEAVAGTRYEAPLMKMLDSERPA